MLKVLLISKEIDKLAAPNLNDCEIVAIVEPGEKALTAIAKYKPDLVLSDAKTAKILNALLLSSVAASRSSIAAKTHQGLQLVPIAEINYFQADDKYVTAYHTKGELLIEDSIASLEREFNQNFIRIHRKTLVAGAKIETLLKNEAGQYFIKLRGVKVELEVSRRQLPKVRKILKWI